MEKNLELEMLQMEECEEATYLCVNMECCDCKWYSNRHCEKFDRPADPSDDLCAYGITRL